MLIERGVVMSDGPAEINGRSFNTEILSPQDVRVLIPHISGLGRYNAAVIGKGGKTYLVAREVDLSKVKRGIPDIGALVVFSSTESGVEEIKRLDLSIPGIRNWEDPRAFTSDQTTIGNNGVGGEDIFIGLTAIRETDNVPIAAVVSGRITNGDFEIDKNSLKAFKNDEGKNVTPISEKELLFRRSGFPHSLELARVVKDSETNQDKLEVEKIIKFPKRPWCEWQIGTQAQMLSDGILPIHGTNRFSLGINPETNQEEYGYTYSLGLAQLDENMNVIKVSDEPLFTRDSFKNILPMGKELDNNKDVIYCCGYFFDGKTVRFVINIGDLMTVEVRREFSQLKGMLDSSKATVHEELKVA